jgi:DNA-binding helix-hairpin-helix protein with protein kinase domain
MEVTLQDGRTMTCADAPFAKGGVGAVYACPGGDHVVKLFEHPRATQRESLQRIVEDYRDVAGEEWAPLFRWPSAIVVGPRLGVLVPRIAQGHIELAWLTRLGALATRPKLRSWKLRLRVALSLAMAVTRLHGHGIAHSDLSDKNVYFHPELGDVTLIDLDGLVVPNVDAPQVIGTPHYIAPEILADPRIPPSTRADHHSLAVLIYQLLLYRHPLLGPRVLSHDPGDDARLALGPDGLYIDHPGDHGNRPTADLWHSFWPSQLMGPQLAALFERAFISGLRDPAARPTAGEWLGALTRLSDRVIGCRDADCPERFFPLTDGFGPQCPWCRSALEVAHHTPVLHLFQSNSGSHYAPEPHAPWWMVASQGRKLFEWHATRGVNASPKALATGALAELQRSRDVWRLHNLGLPELKIVREGRADRVVPIGEHVRLEPGVTLLLGPPPRARAIVIGSFEL